MTALGSDQIEKIATEAAKDILGVQSVTISSSATTDSEGRDALEIKIALPSAAMSNVTGASANNVTYKINQELWKAGDQRFAIIRYSST